jgi:UDP:flavonoid glycosyltransferase YjiC (YdhE family)
MTMNITILTQGSRGDVQPYVALGVGLKNAGYHVCMPAPEVFRSLISDARLKFIPSHGFDPQEFIRNPEIQAAARQGGQLKNLASLLRKAGPLLEGMLDEYWRTSAGADVLIASTLLFGMPDCAEKRGIPLINAPIHAMLVPTRAFPATFFAPWGVRENMVANRMTHSMVQIAFWMMFRATLNRWRLKMGLPRIGNYFGWLQARNAPTLYGFSPSVLPIPNDWPSNHHVTGYWFLEQPTGWQPPAALINFLESGPPPVYVGFGSMDTQDPARMTRLVVNALAASGQRGVLASGWGGLRAESLPETIFPIHEIPHSWLFPQMTALVHHGGMGTTAAGLRSGIPSVILPLGGDQPFWADRVQRLGVGIGSAGYFKITDKRLAADITHALGDSTLRGNAAVLGRKIRAEHGVEQAVELIQKYIH